MYQHDLLGRQEIVRDRTGAQRVLEYDERGNVVRETDPQGRIVVRTFDSRNNRLSETEPYDPANPPDPIPTTTYTYDARTTCSAPPTLSGTHELHLQRDAPGADDHGRPEQHDHERLRPQGQPAHDDRRPDNVTSYTYDARGNVLTQTVTVGGTPQVTRYEYDGYGRLTKETDATGHATSYTYDSNGNRLTQTTTRTSTPAQRTPRRCARPRARNAHHDLRATTATAASRRRPTPTPA